MIAFGQQLGEGVSEIDDTSEEVIFGNKSRDVMTVEVGIRVDEVVVTKLDEAVGIKLDEGAVTIVNISTSLHAGDEDVYRSNMDLPLLLDLVDSFADYLFLRPMPYHLFVYHRNLASYHPEEVVVHEYQRPCSSFRLLVSYLPYLA